MHSTRRQHQCSEETGNERTEEEDIAYAIDHGRVPPQSSSPLAAFAAMLANLFEQERGGDEGRLMGARPRRQPVGAKGSARLRQN